MILITCVETFQENRLESRCHDFTSRQHPPDEWEFLSTVLLPGNSFFKFINSSPGSLMLPALHSPLICTLRLGLQTVLKRMKTKENS